MTKQEVLKEVVAIPNNNILCELPTSFGKTKVALYRTKNLLKNIKSPKILIIIPKLVLIESWKQEIIKWKLNKYIQYITFTTYISLNKHIGEYDIVIFDEAHHLSERSLEFLQYYTIKNSILLSATIKKEHKYALQNNFKDLYCYKISTKDAIDNDILPDPKVFLLPLRLSNNCISEQIIKNPKGKVEIACPYNNPLKWQYLKDKNIKLKLLCTQSQYHLDICSQIEYYKLKYLRTKNIAFKNKWLYLCNERLKWLSETKNTIIKDLLNNLSKHRTLTFCSSIAQTEELGKYCINSKNAKSSEYLNDFNEGKISHITACQSLNEGVNLFNCQIGIYANLNSSETIVSQRLGRILRHKEPIIIIPYYINTREEELKNKMLENYNPKLVNTINNIKDLKI